MAKIDDWKPEVGMEVFIVPWNRRYDPYQSTITKVGRKYFTIDFWDKKFCIDTKHAYIPNFGSDSTCYRCEADYKREQELQNKRREIERNINRLTDEQIDQVYEWITTNTEEQ